MTDEQIHQNIEQLVAEEHELWDREAAGAATEADRRRLEQVKRVPRPVLGLPPPATCAPRVRSRPGRRERQVRGDRRAVRAVARHAPRRSASSEPSSRTPSRRRREKVRAGREPEPDADGDDLAAERAAERRVEPPPDERGDACAITDATRMRASAESVAAVCDTRPDATLHEDQQDDGASEVRERGREREPPDAERVEGREQRRRSAARLPSATYVGIQFDWRP